MLPPLAERMRPRRLADIVGQGHLTGAGGVLQRTVAAGKIPSMIFWGPPGTGKTTLALAIAEELQRPFVSLSAIAAGVKELRDAIATARSTPGGVVLFIDEIHRFNKGQQDALLGAVEQGVISLIGATTENPSFEVNAALLSRCQVYVLNPLGEDDLLGLLHRAMAEDATLKKRQISLDETAALLRYSGGDARRLLNLFELVVEAVAEGDKAVITNQTVARVAQQQTARYDKSGEQHYDIISAFIKSMRGSDPNAAVYWLARMIDGGEEVTFIARRMLIFASEDIGNANPNALLLANATFDAVSKIGFPESRIILAQCATYLASSLKSNASYVAIGEAQEAVKKKGDLPVPLHIRNAPTGLMKGMGYGKGYKYSHEYEGSFAAQEYLPEALQGTKFYNPGQTPREDELRRFLKSRWGDKYGY